MQDKKEHLLKKSDDAPFSPENQISFDQRPTFLESNESLIKQEQTNIVDRLATLQPAAEEENIMDRLQQKLKEDKKQEALKMSMLILEDSDSDEPYVPPTIQPEKQDEIRKLITKAPRANVGKIKCSRGKQLVLTHDEPMDTACSGCK